MCYACGMGAQEHIRFKSPYSLSMRDTVGQYLAPARRQGSGNAASSRDYGRSHLSAVTTSDV